MVEDGATPMMHVSEVEAVDFRILRFLFASVAIGLWIYLSRVGELEKGMEQWRRWEWETQEAL